MHDISARGAFKKLDARIVAVIVRDLSVRGRHVYMTYPPGGDTGS